METEGILINLVNEAKITMIPKTYKDVKNENKRSTLLMVFS